jgi:chorismate mutase
MPQDESEPRQDDAGQTRKAALDALRREIDRLDDAILEQVERRVGAARAIAELKRSDQDSRLRLRPAREAAVIERLVAQADEAPEPLVRQIWREIMACCLDLQVHTDLVVHTAARPAALTDAMRRRFGCAGRMMLVNRPEEAIDHARSHEAIAIIELSSECDWWAGIRHDPSLAMFECLRDEAGKAIAVAIGRISAEDLSACPNIAIQDADDEPPEGELLATCGDLRLVLLPDGGAREAAR